MEIPKYGYIYVRQHTSYDNYDVCKLGKTINIPDRDSQYSTGEIIRGKFTHVYEVKCNQLSIIERLLQCKFKDYNVRYDGGTEFYNKIIISQIGNVFENNYVSYRQLTENEISDLIRKYRVKKMLNKINIRKLINALKTKRKNDNMYQWKPREYQQEIINYCSNKLLENNKIYIELPTGGGKSFIVYNLLRFLRSNFIIICSPRKIINSQNISFKYLQLLNKTFKVFDYSINNNIEDFISSYGNKILICCTQSITKIYNFIKNISTVAIWFDEAHWGVEEWINKLSTKLEFNYLLTDTINIKYRIFTSASPDKKIVSENINIFGELYSPIKINELIKLNWLSLIKPYIYSENKENINKVNYILSQFTDKNRNFGFSFHNYQRNAFNLFYDHYNEYKNLRTNIKPFLLIGNDFTDERLNNISLDYSYRDVSNFEQNNNSIAYVVAKYSIGYDFNKIDFISLTDRKLSIKDIIQSIGRGIRPDELGIDGRNLNKILMILLPIYIDFNEDLKTEYWRVVDVLKYLLYDVEIPLDEFEFIQKISYSPPSENIGNFKKYNGSETIHAIILDLLEYDRIKNLRKDMTYGKAKNLLFEKNIKSKHEYFEFCKTDLRFYENPDEIYSEQFENWVKYLGIPNIYYDFQTCKNKISEYLIKYPEIKNNHLDLFNIAIKLCEIDKNFPSPELWCDYYAINNLNELINISNKKKKRNLGIL